MTDALTTAKANLFIVGAPKCGTTAWVSYLRTHPDIFFPATKEDCFFALDLPRFRTVHSEDEYSALFADGVGRKIRGEASVMYLFSEAAAKAIHAYNSAAKILIFLREQETFLPSLHNQFLQEFSEEIEDFETAWRLSTDRPPESIPAGCLEPRTLNYAAMGRFAEQVERFFAKFPARQVRVVRFEDWIANPRATYVEIMEFLELQDDGRSEFPPINEGSTYRSRNMTRMIVSPPAALRKIVRAMKKFTGPVGQQLHRLALKTARRASLPGYRKISSELRDEIRSFYADNNRRLDELVSSARH